MSPICVVREHLNKPSELLNQPTVLDIHPAILRSLHPNLNIVTMTNPIEALKWAKHKQIDLITTDFSMVQMNGIQFVQAIHQAKLVGALSIIVITVVKDKAIYKALISAGATACLAKPVAASNLKKVAEFLLNKSKQSYHHQQVAIH